MTSYWVLQEEHLPQVNEMINANLEFDSFDPETFRQKTLGDPDFNPALTRVAMDGGKVAGFVMAVARPGENGPSACMKIFAVEESYRNKGIAKQMFADIEHELTELGAKSVSVGFARPNYFTPGVDPRYTVASAFLLRRGYSRTNNAFNMDVDLGASDWDTTELEAKLAQRGITGRRLRPDEKERLREWMAADGFSVGWQYQVMCAAQRDEPAVFIAEQDGEIVGFACYDGVRPGWFGPMGTSEKARGGGIGSLTYLQCLQAMKKDGYKICEINSVGPLYFYSKTSNAVVSRIWWGFAKKLNE